MVYLPIHYTIQNQLNVGKYTINGSYGFSKVTENSNVHCRNELDCRKWMLPRQILEQNTLSCWWCHHCLPQKINKEMGFTRHHGRPKWKDCLINCKGSEGSMLENSLLKGQEVLRFKTLRNKWCSAKAYLSLSSVERRLLKCIACIAIVLTSTYPWWQNAKPRYLGSDFIPRLTISSIAGGLPGGFWKLSTNHQWLVQLSHEKKQKPYFPWNTGCLIGSINHSLLFIIPI